MTEARTLRRLAGSDEYSASETAIFDAAAAELEKLYELLRHADNVVMWEHTSARRGFQEEIEVALLTATS